MVMIEEIASAQNIGWRGPDLGRAGPDPGDLYSRCSLTIASQVHIHRVTELSGLELCHILFPTFGDL